LPTDDVQPLVLNTGKFIYEVQSYGSILD